MSESQGKIRCLSCELVQWLNREDCRRCGAALPQPIVKIVEKVVERVIVRRDPECLEELQQARQLLEAASHRLAQSDMEPMVRVDQRQIADAKGFPTMAEMERTMILAAYRRTNRRPLEAARLLGIGKTTFYRKLRELKQAA